MKVLDFDFSCMVKEIHQNPDGDGPGWLLLSMQVGKITSIFTIFVPANQVEWLVECAEKVKEVNENPDFLSSLKARMYDVVADQFLPDEDRAKLKERAMSSSDFFQRSDFSCTVEEIHQDLESSGGTVLVEVKAGIVSATASFWVCGDELEEFLKTIEVVREAGAKLNAGEGPAFDPIFVGRGCVLVRETDEGEEGANVNQNDET